MIFTNILCVALALTSQALGAIVDPTRDAKEVSKSYIVTLKDAVSKEAVLSNLRSTRKASNIADSKITEWDRVIHGFAGNEVLSLRESSDIVNIEEDGFVHAFATQTNAPWGIARLSSRSALPQNPSALNFTFIYDPSAGAGVDIYFLDTGVRVTHQEFGGRARGGAVFAGTSQASLSSHFPADGNGHGTHVAGTAAGSRVGVAKAASVISVKVLGDNGYVAHLDPLVPVTQYFVVERSATIAQVISGVNWIGTNAAASGRPAVVLIALGGSPSTALDSAVTALTNAGIHVVVAAGGSNTGSENTSPGRVPSVILVGATTIADARASFSNYGSLIDVFAPGVNIYSSWNTADNAYNTLSGNSMAAAHVAGVVAYLLGLEGNVSPAAMQAKVRARALSGVLTSIPSGTLNLLAQI
ncbi:serine protease [Coprinopsis sp. MPI-PUGE-AT-0042]|nr:serine protease [Coprinopsis sp. MPI-PUGE-AT-0042]